MRVIPHYPITTTTSHRPDRAGLTESRVLVLVVDLLVLVSHQRSRPTLLIPFRGDQPSHLHVISNGEVLLVRGSDETQVRHHGPLPSRPEDRAHHGFHRTRRHVHEQPCDLPVSDRLQVLSHSIQVPPV